VRKQALAAADLVRVVVVELEVAVTQLEDRHVGRRADFQRPAILERREHLRGMCRRAGDDVRDLHAVTEHLRQAVRQIDDAGRAAHGVPVGRDRVRPEILLHHRLDDVPADVAGDAVADVEPDPRLRARAHRRQNAPGVIEDAVRRRREHVGDDVAFLQDVEQLRQRRRALAHVNHHRHAVLRRGLLGALQHFVIVLGVGAREPRLDADDEVAVPGDRIGDRGHIREREVHRVAVRQDAGAADVDQHPSDLR
jgi:hypothetical protein